MTIVCLDTQIIRWGVMKQKSTTPNADDLIDKASYFIDWLDKQKADIILPSFVIGELLVTVPESEHSNVLCLLSEDWMIVDYDLRAAQQFAIMRYQQALRQIMNDIRDGNPYASRRQLIADVMIMSTAIVHGAEKIYTYDNDFVKLAAGFIDAENFTNVEVQSNFFRHLDNSS